MEKQESQTELVPASVQAVATHPDSYWLKQLPGGTVTSLDLSTDPGRRDFVRQQIDDLKNFKESINQSVCVRDVLLHEVAEEDEETGEVRYWGRIVLFLTDGTILHGGSSGIMQSLRNAVILFGPPPWKNGVDGVISLKRTRKGRDWMYIQWTSTPSGPNTAAAASNGKQPSSGKTRTSFSKSP